MIIKNGSPAELSLLEQITIGILPIGHTLFNSIHLESNFYRIWFGLPHLKDYPCAPPDPTGIILSDLQHLKISRSRSPWLLTGCTSRSTLLVHSSAKLILATCIKYL